MSHLQPIEQYACWRCKKKRAVYELINDRSAMIGRYCRSCGIRALDDFRHPKKAGAGTTT